MTEKMLENSEKELAQANLTGRHVLKNVIETVDTFDTIICCSDGKIGAHRLVLYSISPFFAILLDDSNQKYSEINTIIIPDISLFMMKLILQLAYHGTLIYDKTEESDLCEAIEYLHVLDNHSFSISQVVIKPLTELTPTKPTIPNSNSDISVCSSQEISDFYATDDCDNESHSEEPKSAKSRKTSKRHKQDKPSYTCNNCKRVFTHGRIFNKHIECCTTIPFKEQQILASCDFCKAQYKTYAKATECLSQHGQKRCMICLEVFRKGEIELHYQEHLIFNGMAKCRWCKKMIKETEIVKHSLVTHRDSFVGAKKSLPPDSASDSRSKTNENRSKTNEDRSKTSKDSCASPPAKQRKTESRLRLKSSSGAKAPNAVFVTEGNVRRLLTTEAAMKRLLIRNCSVKLDKSIVDKIMKEKNGKKKNEDLKEILYIPAGETYPSNRLFPIFEIRKFGLNANGDNQSVGRELDSRSGKEMHEKSPSPALTLSSGIGSAASSEHPNHLYDEEGKRNTQILGLSYEDSNDPEPVVRPKNMSSKLKHEGDLYKPELFHLADKLSHLVE